MLEMLYSLQIALWTPFVFIFLYILLNYFVKGEKCVCIVVLGDIGRSPRMQYHALSFAKHGFVANIVGYKGSLPHKLLRENRNIEINPVREPPRIFQKIPGVAGFVLKVIWQSAFLALTLLLLPKSKYIMLQNPPTIPTFVVAWFVCVMRTCQLVIDWHNYGYTILALKLGSKHPLVFISKWVERLFGRLAATNICVTNAMREDLARNWNINATTVYDRPPDIFKSASLQEQHDLFMRLSQDYPVFQARPPSQSATRFTCHSSEGALTKSSARPVLVVSSTSWTEDEDFEVLLKALEVYDQEATEDTPSVLCVITGKGPQKEMYTEKIRSQPWKRVEFCLPWLAAEDYPLLLGSADVGVCLHMSSSGLDLPMKVVDMFGCQLPVCAVRYNCIEELVHHDETGLLFDDSHQLAKQLQDLLNGFPERLDKLEDYRKNLKVFQDSRWEPQWQARVLPLFLTQDKN